MNTSARSSPGPASGEAMRRAASAGTAASAPGQEGVPAIDSAGLLQGGKVLAIRHRGEIYRLQETRQGKLILTK